ncbi:MAG: GyrI-like domain-containing protein [Brevundimonas sp.]|uniref:GyrI-like domain-containing protein n=1 Tax=Brevundimonas sp. TaxID=1871086 RepID=UPI0027338165|nr:GyrI-like domain-containing protein [Brevundimonas sp.]MDP3405174.1 GyrI-like domain-containing protein [Brevundimonas sp.]
MTEEELVDLTQNRAALMALYAPPTRGFSMIEVPRLPFAVLDGEGPPDPTAIADAVKTLYTSIYPIRREARERMGKAFVEAPVEVLYWADDMRDLASGQREKWQWRVQVTLPVWADEMRLEASVAEMRHELGGAAAPRWNAVAEGQCAQTLHVGPTEDMPAILQGLYGDYLPGQGLEAAGPYHEIYLDDWNRVAPLQRRVILRQPVRQLA